MGMFTVHNQGGSIFFQNTKVTCILLYNLGGCLYFPLKHKSAMYTFVQQGGGGGGGVGPEETQITKVCTNVHTCMYICHLAPRPTSAFWICTDNFESGQFFSEKNRKFYINSVKNM